jgi:AcrR family transcriptional regulator
VTAPRMKFAPSPAPEPDETDGRRRRSQDSRARIVAAMLELVHTGDVSPGAEQVAARAGVGLRTVFRHFNDMDSLYSEMSQVIESEIRSVIDSPFTGATWHDRVVELVNRRAAVFEKIAPFKRASDIHRHQSHFLQASHERLISISREILKRELPAELARDQFTFESLDMLLSFEAWSRLRRDQDLTPRRARELLEQAIRKVIS